MSSEMAAVNSLQSVDVLFVPGIGPERAGLLHKLGIFSVHDLLYYFPFRYDELTSSSVALEDGTKVSLVVTVSGPPAVRFRASRSTVTVPVQSDDKALKAVFFNQPYVRHQATIGKTLRITGSYNNRYSSVQVSSYEFLKDEVSAPSNPIYRVTENLSVKTLRKMITTALRTHGVQLEDRLPATLRDRFKLVSIQDAVLFMHNPQDAEQLRQAHRRLVFEEFLLFQLRLAMQRYRNRETTHQPLNVLSLQQGVIKYLDTLPFTITQAQKQAIAEILQDMASGIPMYRMLQGDVGSGKTAVAFAVMVALAKMNFQSALMAPTSILARQHFLEAEQFLKPLGIQVVLLTGSSPDRHKTLAMIRDRHVDVVIGTHALVQERVEFSTLRLAVIDEQHRFGVQARKMLRQKGGAAVDVLQLSATPIPRSLALTLYGDIAISTMRERPPLRVPIETLVFSLRKEQLALQRLQKELAKGRQAYIVAPRIESLSIEQEELSAIGLYEKFKEQLGFWTVGLLHGAMSESSRIEVMEAFVQGALQVLVATSIIEVGVSVANATVMMIYDADRFGLATLHQLRGRVGRSNHASVCILLADPSTDVARERLQLMQQTEDGFILARKDLQLRGPGEVFGDRQSGLPTFQVGDPIRDLRIMEVARDEVATLMSSGDLWLLPAYAPLLRYALRETESLADS